MNNRNWCHQGSSYSGTRTKICHQWG